MQEQVNKAMASLSETVGQDVPTFDEVREKIEARYAKAKGMSELTESRWSPACSRWSRRRGRRKLTRVRARCVREQLGLTSGPSEPDPTEKPEP